MSCITCRSRAERLSFAPPQSDCCRTASCSVRTWSCARAGGPGATSSTISCWRGNGSAMLSPRRSSSGPARPGLGSCAAARQTGGVTGTNGGYIAGWEMTAAETGDARPAGGAVGIAELAGTIAHTLVFALGYAYVIGTASLLGFDALPGAIYPAAAVLAAITILLH